MKKDDIKQPVRLREKSLKNGVKSLYLDIYQDGQRRYQYLKLYINPGTDPLTKMKNKAAMDAARVIQARKLVDLQSNMADIMTASSRRIKFVDYYREYYESKYDISNSSRKRANHALDRWIEFAGKDVLLCKVTSEMLSGFVKHLKSSVCMHKCRKVSISAGEGREKSFILTSDAEKLIRKMACVQKKTVEQIAKETGISESTIKHAYKRIIAGQEDRRLAETTVHIYFITVAAVLHKAYRKRLIPSDPADMLDRAERPGGRSAERTYLTFEEVTKMIDTACCYPVVKNMFLFSCFTGLRYSDVKALTWGKIDDSMIGTTMQKTKEPVYVPISNNARRWLPDRGDAQGSDFVFSGMPTAPAVNKCIDKWTKEAGIDKHVTFHCARHTFATLSLEYGADLYTISKLLGHRNISTTQVYAKIIDEKKVEAVNLIPDLKE